LWTSGEHLIIAFVSLIYFYKFFIEVEKSQKNILSPSSEVQKQIDAISELLLIPSFMECLASKLRDHLFPLKKAQKPNSTSIPGVQLICWSCKKHGHKKIHCPDLSCYYCGKRGHCKRICLTYRLSVWYDREQKIRKNAPHNGKPLFVRNTKSPPVSTESSYPKHVRRGKMEIEKEKSTHHPKPKQKIPRSPQKFVKNKQTIFVRKEIMEIEKKKCPIRRSPSEEDCK